MASAPRAGGPLPTVSSPDGRRPSGATPTTKGLEAGVGLGWLADALSDAGLSVHEVPGWRSRAAAGPFAPAGVLIHHTGTLATPESPAPSLAAMVGDDVPGSPGPRCHVLVDRNGECWVVAAGRAHHAGVAHASGPLPGGAADALYVGVQIEYAATSAQPTQHATSVQKSVAVLVAARLVGALGRDHGHVRAHKETSTTGRTDPFNWDMVSIRDSVRQTLERTGW